jgi:hypothetical protein
MPDRQAHQRGFRSESEEWPIEQPYMALCSAANTSRFPRPRPAPHKAAESASARVVHLRQTCCKGTPSISADASKKV